MLPSRRCILFQPVGITIPIGGEFRVFWDFIVTTILSILGLIVVAGVFFGGAGQAADPEDEDSLNEDERWAELVSADRCDTYWDPPNDDI